ncbi:MAG: hypothetical protein GY807_24800 [Gammaproteobacteria bacterium]|nr:hypothetical protein [Gammaproteobacteria bacterium]
MEQLKPLQVYDPNTGEWFRRDEHTKRCCIPKGKPFVGPIGKGVCVSQGNAMEKYVHLTLTPCEAPEAMQIGEAVLELAKGNEIHDIQGYSACIESQIVVRLKKPAPLKGLDWLKSLPVGTRIRTPREKLRVVVVHDGLKYVDSGSMYKWRCVNILTWTDTASPETCPEWIPE